MKEQYKVILASLVALLLLFSGWHYASPFLGDLTPRKVWEWLAGGPGGGGHVAGSSNSTQSPPRMGPEIVCFEMPQIVKDPFNHTYDRLLMEGCSYITTSGHPMLPVKTVTFKLNPGYSVYRVAVEVTRVRELNGTYRVMPALKPAILVGNSSSSITEPDPAIYSSDRPYPGEWFTYRLAVGLDAETMTRVKYVIVRLYPVQYIPAEGRIYVAEEMKITVGYDGTPKFLTPKADLLIVTSPELEEHALGLASYRNSTGVRTVVRTTSWIYEHYDGRDEAEKIRNCINESVNTLGITYVLLFGDHDQVPARLVYIPDGAYDHTPTDGSEVETDLYYADLQYTWDDNNDSKWGDLANDRVDGIPDVYVGRLPVDTPEEASAVVSKIIGYESSTTHIMEWFRRMVLVGTDPFDPKGAEGEIIKDYIAENFMWRDFTPIRLYETAGNLSRHSVKLYIDQGCGILNHVGHGDIGSWRLPVGYYTTSDAEAQTNGLQLPAVITLSCLTSRFSDAECLGEAFILNPDGGAIAYIGPTRIAWGYSGNDAINGLGGEMDWRLCKAFFDGNREVGKFWGQAITEYVQNHDIYTKYDNFYYIDWKTVAEYGSPLSDPTLLLGGRGGEASLAVRCVDGDGEAASGISVELYTAGGYTVGVEETNSTGWAYFPSIVDGNYTVKAYLNEVEVASQQLEVKGETVADLPCGIYDCRVVALDGDGDGVGGANITLQSGGTHVSSISGADGSAYFQNLPSATYEVRVSYLGVEVHSSNVTLSGEEQEIRLAVRVYDFYIRCVGWDGAGVGGALVNVSGPAGITRVETTNSTGFASFENMPGGNYTYAVTHMDVDMGGGSVSLVEEGQVEVLALRLYSLFIQVLDGGEEPLEGALVRLYRGNRTLLVGVTNSTGWIRFPGLLNGTYTYRVEWRGVSVSPAVNVTVQGGGVETRVVPVYDLILQCVDPDEGKPTGVHLRLFNSTGLVWEGSVDPWGRVTLENLVNATYSYEAYYWGVRVSSGEFLLNEEDLGVEVACTLYDWNIRCLDGGGEPLPGALVEIRLWNGTLYANLTSSEDGTVRLENLPPQTYNITVFWMGVEAASTQLSLSGEEQLDDVGCSVYDLLVEVLDGFGHTILGANVTLTWPNGTRVVVVKSDKSGLVLFENIPALTYELRVDMHGFKEYECTVELMKQEHLKVTLERIPLSIPPMVDTLKFGLVTAAAIILALLLLLL